MTTFREGTGRTVISRTTAESVGQVQHFTVSPDEQRITALVIDAKHQRLIDWSAIESFGHDAVVVESESVAREPVNESEKRATAGELDMVGKLVLSDLGNSCGTTHDVEFDAQSGRLSTLSTDQGRIDAARLVGVGDYAVVVREDPDAELTGE